jgi:tRNA(Leu) C34 or U34 (ribose-2'-O)-methylase TrmL
VRGFCGIGIYHGKTEANQGTLWRSAFAYGASFVFTVGRRFREQASDTAKTYRHIPMYNYHNMEDLLAHLPHSCRLVAVELDARARSLNRNYVHFEQACYLLGAEDHGIPRSVLDQCHDVIQIPTRVCLNVAAAGTIVLHDRATKQTEDLGPKAVRSKGGKAVEASGMITVCHVR